MDQRLLDLVGDSIKRNNVDIRLTLPGIIPRGGTFSLRINAIGSNSLPVTDFEDEIEFVESVGIEGLPSSVKFSASDRGSMVVDNLKAVGPGYCHVRAKPSYSFRKTVLSPV